MTVRRALLLDAVALVPVIAMAWFVLAVGMPVG